MNQDPPTDRTILLDVTAADSRVTTREVLVSYRYDVVEAGGDIDGLNYLHIKPELVVIFLDLEMEGISSLEFLDIIKIDVLLARIPVVVLSDQEEHPEAAEHRTIARHLR